jgi:hypothetical protein
MSFCLRETCALPGNYTASSGNFLLIFWGNHTLEDGIETYVGNYHHSLRNNPEERTTNSRQKPEITHYLRVYLKQMFH